MTSGSGNALNETVTIDSLSELVPLPDSTQDRPGEFFVAEDESDSICPGRLIQIFPEDDEDGESGADRAARDVESLRNQEGEREVEHENEDHCLQELDQ